MSSDVWAVIGVHRDGDVTTHGILDRLDNEFSAHRRRVELEKQGAWCSVQLLPDGKLSGPARELFNLALAHIGDE